MGGCRVPLLLFIVFLFFYYSAFSLSYSYAETLNGTPQDDIIISEDVYDGIISYEGDDTIEIQSGSEIIGESQRTAESTADADVVAIDSGSGDDEVTNSGIIEANADAIALPVGDIASWATANGVGISTGDGADLILNFYSLIADVTSYSETSSFSLFPPSEIAFGTAEAFARGIDAGADDDQITNSSLIKTIVTATANADDSCLPPKATAHSIGIDSGSGNDTVTNEGDLDVTAVSESEPIDDSLTQDVEGGAISESIAVGIQTHDGDDSIENDERVKATAEANANSESTVVTLFSDGTQAAPTVATTGATGIDGGAGSDIITNSNTIEANAESHAYTGSGKVTALQYEVTAVGDARTEAEATATGMAAGDGDDEAVNNGTIILTAGATATTVDVSIEVMGDVKANAATISSASAVGIDGGAGNDGGTENEGICNTGSIIMNSITASSESNAIDVKMISIPTEIGEFFGAELGDAKTEAETHATGIAGGTGNDTINNLGTIDIFTQADADSNEVTATLNVTASPKISSASPAVLGTASVAVAGSTVQLAASEAQDTEEDNDAVGDTVGAGTNAQAFVTGIDGGNGVDTVHNAGRVTVTGESDTDSVSVSPTISIAKGSLLNLVPGTSLAEAGTKAETKATGIDGGSGNDTLTNENELVVVANAYSTSASVAPLFKETTTKGLAWGGALSSAKTEAIATAVGIAGAEDDDIVVNSGKVSVTAFPDADSASIAATLMGAKEGLVAGFSYADAETVADGTAIGISGGTGGDTLTNTSTGVIEVTANPTSSSASVGVTLEGVFSQEWSAVLGGAVTDGNTRAVSTVTGIDAGEDEDTVTNEGEITLTTNPDADSASVTVTLTGTQDGLAAGFSYADAETTAEADAVGISGGTGADTLTNASTGLIEVTADPTSSSASVDVTLSGAIKGTGIVGGAAMADGTTRAIASAIGIDGNEGNDVITNDGEIVLNTSPDADSASIVTNIGASLGELGLVGGFSYADNETTSQATAVGIDGGVGNDIITNTRNGDIEVTTGTTSTSASIAVTVEAVKGLGAAAGGALTDGTTKAISNASGINGGDGEDTLDNFGTITVDSQSTAKSTSVSVDIVGGKEGMAAGVSYSDASTTAEATAAGIASRGGSATVTNNGTIISAATAKTDSESVSITASAEKIGLAAGVSIADLTVKSTADSYGIDTGTTGYDNDVVYNLGTVDTDAIATATTDTVAVTFAAAKTGVTAGVSAVESDVTAMTAAVGARTGRGDDEIVNAGIENEDGYSLDSYAHSTASSDDTAVTISGAWEGVALGASLAKADTSAVATATGIDAGEDNDTVTSESGLKAKAESNVTSDTVSVTVALAYKGVSAGVALSSTKTDSKAEAAGIDGGDGIDQVTNRSSLEAEAIATTKTKTITINIAEVGTAISDASSTAASEAVGLDGGRGVDSLINEGDITVTAASIADDTQTTANFVGYASGDVDSTATATATGIRGDTANDAAAAGDTIENRANGSIDIDSRARLDATDYVVQGGGAAFAEATGTIEALAAGIASGAGADSVVNGGSVDVTARSEADVSSMELQFSGVSAGKAGADLTTRATGIDAGHGNNTITNAPDDTITNAPTPLITVHSKADAIATSCALNLGVSLQRAAISAETHSTGILSGDDNDTITNKGDIVVTGATRMGAAAGDISLAGLSTSDSVSKASVEGINAGGGDDKIVNTGSITAGNIPGGGDPMAYVEVANVSISFSKIGLGFLSSKALATGILGGNGDDTITNTGTIRIGNDDWMSESKSVGFHGNFLEFFSLTGVGVAGETVSTGISGGQGNDGITNESSGMLDVKATAYAISDGTADIWTFGSPTVFSNSKTTATAKGISGGQGDDVIINLGKVAAKAEARADATTDAWVGWGNPTADSSSHALASAWGIDAGAGWNYIRNEGEISVNSIAGAYSFAKADSNVDETESTADSWSEASSYGVVGGNDGNTVFNTATGSITATARARTHDPMTLMKTKAESDEYATSKTSKPVTAYSAGISLGDGDDTVVNDGEITIVSESDAWSKAASNSWPNSAQSEADAHGEATAKGIAAGEGKNSITNTGLIDVYAWGNADAIADSFSRDDTSSSTAFADAEATAIGMEANGHLVNAMSDINDLSAIINLPGIIEVKARATTHAKTGSNDPESEETTATAHLKATATGIGTVSDAIRSEPDRIRNDGIITVAALTGENDKGNPELIAQAKVDTDVTKNQAEARGASEADAAGIRAGNNNAEITNTVVINVLARSRAHISAYSDEDSDAVTGVDEDTAVTAQATGIRAGDGDNTITNSGSVTVESVVTTNSRSTASSNTDPATATSKAGASTDAAGIRVGNGNNTIKNDGSLTVTAENTATAMADYPSAHLDNAFAYAGAEDSTLTSEATGISVGDGVNDIENHNSIIVSSTIDAEARAYANTTTTTTQAEAHAGGDAKATGIFAGNGQNKIKNFGSMVVSATADAYAKGDADEYGYAYIGSESSPGIIAQAIGISAGHGVNEIYNYGTLEVNSTATAKSVVVGDEATKAIANSYATATGIRTGDGINIVSNSGAINVTADGKNSSAIGIQTGDGDDVIENYGTISATNINIGVASLGVTISSAAGNDQVFLMDGSESIGQINLGDGDDRLTLLGTVLVADEVTGAAGLDTLIFDGPGSIDSIPMAFENAVKQGVGTYSVSGLPTMQRIEVNQGTLQVESSYAMTDDSSFKTYMNGDGSHGQLNVNGTAQLNGDLNMVKGPGVFINGTLYDIILADEVEGIFSSETLPEDKPLLSFQTHTYPDRVQVEALSKSFTTVAANSLQRKIARHLDRIMPNATGDLSLVLGEFQDLSEPGFKGAFAGFSPDSYNDSTRTTLNSTQHSDKTIQQRMHSLRAGLKTAAAETRPGYGVWGQGFGQWGDQDGEDGYTGYDYDLYGWTLGADRFLNDHMLLGVSLGFCKADIDFEKNRGNGDIDAFIGSLYGSWFSERYYLDASLSYGFQEYDNTRNITIGGIKRSAISDHDGNIFSGYLEGGYNHSFGKWILGPFGTLNYLYLDEDGFTESGAGGLNLSVDDRQTDAMLSQLGAVVAGRLTYENFELMPELRLAWKHDFDIDDQVTTSVFAGAPGVKFSIDGQDTERNSLMVEVGATLFHKNGLSIPIKYAAELRDGYTSYGVLGQIRYEF